MTDAHAPPTAWAPAGPGVRPGLQRVLVGTDLGPHATLALGRALRLPYAPAATLALVHVLAPGEDARAARLARALATRPLATAAARARRARGPGAPEVRAQLREGRLTEELARAAHELGAQLVVLGTPHLVGSRLERLRDRLAGGLLDLPVPALLLVARTALRRYRRPLVALGLEPGWRRVLEAGLALCPDAPGVSVLHAADACYDLVLRAVDADLGRFEGHHLLLEHEARAALEQRLARYERPGQRLVARVRAGLVEEVLPEEAARVRPDLLVVGRHRRPAVGRLVNPHVAEAALAPGTCDVLVVDADPVPAPR